MLFFAGFWFFVSFALFIFIWSAYASIFHFLAKSQYRVYIYCAHTVYKARTSMNLKYWRCFFCGCCFCALSNADDAVKNKWHTKKHNNSKYKSCLWFIGCYCNFLWVRIAYSQFPLQRYNLLSFIGIFDSDIVESKIRSFQYIYGFLQCSYFDCIIANALNAKCICNMARSSVQQL